jgi:signal transduction histidine kinase
MPRYTQSNPLKILVVEDNASDFLLLKENIKLCKGLPADIQLAETLTDAIDHLRQNKPDVVFLDLFLPDGLGLDSFNQLKEYTTNAAVIILSGLSDTKTALEAITLGAQDYLAKGEFDEKLLEKTIRYSMERKNSMETLRLAQLEQQRAVTEATIKGQEKEREQLGVELHDNINQILATSRLYLDFALSESPVRKDIVEKSKEFITQAIEEIRRLSKALLPPSFDEFGLLTALNDLAQCIAMAGKFSIERNWDGFDERVLQKDQKLTIYRIVQEQLNNIIKHAAATNVIITLRLVNDRQNENLELVIKDDGKGFDPAQKRNGVGLRNIISRGEVFGGTVTIQSKPGKGCELRVILPGTHTD